METEPEGLPDQIIKQYMEMEAEEDAEDEEDEKRE